MLRQIIGACLGTLAFSYVEQMNVTIQTLQRQLAAEPKPFRACFTGLIDRLLTPGKSVRLL